MSSKYNLGVLTGAGVLEDEDSADAQIGSLRVESAAAGGLGHGQQGREQSGEAQWETQGGIRKWRSPSQLRTADPS